MFYVEGNRCLSDFKNTLFLLVRNSESKLDFYLFTCDVVSTWCIFS